MTKFCSLARARVIGPEGGAWGGGASGDAKEGATGVDVLVVSSSNETLTKAPKYYEPHQNMTLGSNRVDQVRSLQKIPMRLHGTNLYINCTNSTYFAPSFVQ